MHPSIAHALLIYALTAVIAFAVALLMKGMNALLSRRNQKPTV